jgi:hypothetical protein
MHRYVHGQHGVTPAWVEPSNIIIGRLMVMVMVDEHNAPAERMKQEVREQALLQPRFESYAGAQALPGARRGRDPPVGLPEAQPGAEPLHRRNTVV